MLLQTSGLVGLAGLLMIITKCLRNHSK